MADRPCNTHEGGVQGTSFSLGGVADGVSVGEQPRDTQCVGKSPPEHLIDLSITIYLAPEVLEGSPCIPASQLELFSEGAPCVQPRAHVAVLLNDTDMLH